MGWEGESKEKALINLKNADVTLVELNRIMQGIKEPTRKNVLAHFDNEDRFLLLHSSVKQSWTEFFHLSIGNIEKPKRCNKTKLPVTNLKEMAK